MDTADIEKIVVVIPEEEEAEVTSEPDLAVALTEPEGEPESEEAPAEEQAEPVTAV